VLFLIWKERKQMRQAKIPFYAFTVVVSFFGASSALGDVVTYDVSHTFSFSPSGGVTSPVSYLFGVSAQASPGGTLNAKNGSVVFGTGGGTSSNQASSAGSLSSATATSSATLNPFSIGGPVSGVIGSNGSIVVLPGGTCCAVSSAAVVLHGGTSASHGSADYAPEMSMAGPEAGPNSTNEVDPIDFQVIDLMTGAVKTGTLFDVSSDLQDGGSWSWGGGAFALNASNFDFSISLNSPYTVQQGTADLRVRNGIITTSDGSGMFAGIFPAVGTPGNFSVPFGNNFPIDYNLGNFNGDPLDVEFTFGNSGLACTVPEPSFVFLLGGLLSVLYYYKCWQRKRSNLG
jgi:hypothetical protein